LRHANEVLEQRIVERDAALAALRAETAERERVQAMLRQAQKMEGLGQLTGGIAHDFNNLLTVVIGNLEMIGRRAGPDEALRRGITNAGTAANRAATLTQQLLAFSRKQPLQPVDLDPNRLVQSAIEFFARTLGDNIVVERDFDPDVNWVHVDLNQLENALLNLAVNAKDAMPAGGTLTFRTRNSHHDGGAGSSVIIEVSDNGSGMTEAVKDKAFDPFFTTKPVGRGSGLGLSQVHGFVAQSQGELELESSPGHGTTVRIILPAVACVALTA
jgi:signal transduction histidine kinase